MVIGGTPELLSLQPIDSMAAHFSPRALTKTAAASLAVAGMLQLSNAAEAAPKRLTQINTGVIPATFNITTSGRESTTSQPQLQTPSRYSLKSGIQEKINNGTGIQDLGRVDQITGRLSRKDNRGFERYGLTTPSVQSPENNYGSMVGREAIKSEAERHSPSSRFNGSEGRGASMLPPPTSGDYYIPGQREEEADKVRQEAAKEAAKDFAKTTAKAGPIAGLASATKTLLWETGKGAIQSMLNIAKEAEDRKEKLSQEAKKNPNPESDGAYGTYDISGKPDPLGVLKKLNTNRDRLKTLNPTIDPNRDSDHVNGNYTGPSIGGITSSNGGTSTGSWYHPYGKGGYTGPNVDAIRNSHGGTSTGGFKPPF